MELLVFVMNKRLNLCSSPVNSVLRSASFHTTRQLSGAPQSSSEEEDEEEEDMTLSAEDWPQKLVNVGSHFFIITNVSIYIGRKYLHFILYNGQLEHSQS